MDLYKRDLSGATWQTPCGGNTGDSGTDESCVSFAEIPGTDAFALRDTKRPDAESLRFTAAELDRFVQSWRSD